MVGAINISRDARIVVTLATRSPERGWRTGTVTTHRTGSMASSPSSLLRAFFKRGELPPPRNALQTFAQPLPRMVSCCWQGGAVPPFAGAS